jgi:DivIVA domain-containing protein
LELDRAFIERRNFQQVRRGYDPEAVDRHLAEIADEADALQQTVDELRRDQTDHTPEPPTLSGVAAEQVRVIVEAAERSASVIETQARDEAETRGREAETRARELAGVTDTRIQTLVSRVDQVTDLLLQRVDSVEAELSTLREGTRSLNSALDGLGERSAPLRSEIEEMRAGVYELRDDPDSPLGGSGSSPRAGSGRLGAGAMGVGAMPAEPDLDSELEPVIEPEDARAPGRRRGGARGAPAEPRGAEEEIAPEATDEPAILPEEERAEEAAVAEREEELAEAEAEAELGDDDVVVIEEVEVVEIEEEEVPVDAGASEEEEGARLVALNMALNGVPRDETDRYLAENFDLSDRSTVLDDVYARVGEA